jgi:tRNA(His) guanylyltransferase
MKFDDLGLKMRYFETQHDRCVPPGIYMVARLDGRGFTKLTKEFHQFEAPFDGRFRDYMTETLKHLFSCGFHIVFGYIESDEMSLLFQLEETAFSRKARKYNSVLAGEASAKFSLLLGDIGAFDCRISELPSRELVVDYFRWRSEDAHRNALNAYCYWRLRQNGLTKTAATARIERLGTSEKKSLLLELGVDFDQLPAWQKRGIGVYWATVEKEGYNPISKIKLLVNRRELRMEYELPQGEVFDELLSSLMAASEAIKEGG